MSLWQEEARADAALCGAVMGTSRLWWGQACLLSGVWAALVWRDALMWTWWVSLAACLGQTWLTMRCQLDARLFQQMAHPKGGWLSGMALDASLRRVLGVRRHRVDGVKPQSDTADMADRIAGALRLYRSAVSLSVVHAAALGLLWGWIWAFGRG